ncbi:hypothetical protein B0J13DRAFT_517379 [Dactylonectria estremocensis]|uniref:Secreted protein n=1 Tax=Dactylonectria estremocensis TaxID=1079267 RepID=A0A9P9FI48_9HYPO|nr:hypothetical protein B0J13DRAFT_517379 [Dactylonectria estremocensis]
MYVLLAAVCCLLLASMRQPCRWMQRPASAGADLLLLAQFLLSPGPIPLPSSCDLSYLRIYLTGSGRPFIPWGFLQLSAARRLHHPMSHGDLGSAHTAVRTGLWPPELNCFLLVGLPHQLTLSSPPQLNEAPPHTAKCQATSHGRKNCCASDELDLGAAGDWHSGKMSLSTQSECKPNWPSTATAPGGRWPIRGPKQIRGEEC